MIRLIRNELKKIFSKSALYIVLIITIAMCIFNNIITKNFSNKFTENYSEINKKSYELQLQYAKENKDEETILESESYLEAYKIAEQYPQGGWQRYVIGEQLQPIIRNMKSAQNDEETKEYKDEYDRIIKCFEKDDGWKNIALRELDDINEQLEEQNDPQSIETLQDQKQVIEWRLKKDIPYGSNDINKYLSNWLIAKSQIREFEKNVNPSYDAKRINQENIETVKICEYAIENKINDNITEGGGPQLQYSLSENSRSLLLDVFSSYGFFILIAVVIIAGTIVSEEFNKGTVKLLLVRPFERTKILLAKFISCLVVLVVAYISVVLIQTIVGGIIFGFGSYADKTIMYNLNTNSIEKIGTLQYLIMSGLMILPEYLLLMTLAFSISTIFVNSPIAVTLPCLGIIGSEIINTLVMNYEKAKFLLYFVTPNWDLNIFAFGRMPEFKGLTMPFSITICLVYFIIMLVASIIAFKKRNIKNI